ncbi:DUF501 domain-containing protein [bacterium]|nr:DUF501 domain-containing protein [bacterium]
MPRFDESQTTDDKELIDRFLGRKSRFPCRIMTRCPGGTPQVIFTDPVHLEEGRWKPFPAFLWLVCPRLQREVSKLEGEHFSKKALECLENDEDLLKSYLSGQKSVAEWRTKLAMQRLPNGVPPDIQKVMEETNISGSHFITSLKCLHSHVAQTLAFGQNPIGEMVLDQIGPCSPNLSCT